MNGIYRNSLKKNLREELIKYFSSISIYSLGKVILIEFPPASIIQFIIILPPNQQNPHHKSKQIQLDLL